MDRREVARETGAEQMHVRRFDASRDAESALRIWTEVGWVEPAEKHQEEALASFLSGADAWVAELRGRPECIVATMPGTFMHLSQEIRMRAVMAVTTSRVARRQGLASRLTAHALSHGARTGELVSFLGMFDQGFYNKLGYGSGSYERHISFDPAMLSVEGRPRMPYRLSTEQAAQMHQNRLERMRAHGACNILPEAATRGEMMFSKGGFGLGYYDESGRLTHHLWAVANGENGPYRVEWLAYETVAQLLELLRLIKSLSDQVYSVSLHEPAWLQMQDLLDQPFRHSSLTEGGKMEHRWESFAYWQLRILDLEKLMAVTSIPTGETISFNLRLIDPIARYVETETGRSNSEKGGSEDHGTDTEGWNGLGGDYIVTLGEVSHARAGYERSLPSMQSSVNAFSRLWLGAASPFSLAVTDELRAPPALLETLSRQLRMPKPSLDWLF